MPYDNTERQNRQKLRQQKEDLQGNRLLVLFCVTALGLVLLTTCQTNGLFKYSANLTAAEKLALIITACVGIAAFTAGIAWALVSRLKHLSKQRVFGPAGLISIGFCIAMSALFIGYMGGVGYRLSFLLVAVGAGLFVCKLLFPPELYISAIFLGGGAIVTYLIYKLVTTVLEGLLPLNLWKTVLFSTVGVLGFCGILLVFLWIKRGEIGINGKKVRIFREKFGYGWPLFAIITVIAALAVSYFGITSPDFNVQLAAFALYGIMGVSLVYAVWHIIKMI